MAQIQMLTLPTQVKVSFHSFNERYLGKYVTYL
jgi:hypothetical protein